MKSRGKSNTKLVTLLALLTIVAIAMGIALGLYLTDKDWTGADSHEPQKRLDYKKIDAYKVNAGPVVRCVYEALIEGEKSKNELIEISENIVEEMIKERKGFQALAIYYYTHKELLDHPPALGIYTYAPDGEWGDAGMGKADFSNFRGNPSGLVDKDWAMKPTDKEIEMFKIYSNYELVDDGIERVASEYNISFEEARTSINKVINWIYK